MTNQVLVGDNLDVMRGMADASVDAIVTDPPAGINFMNVAFDSDRGGRDAWIAWLAGVMAEAYRVAKPGAHAVVWALPRTSGWTHRAIEDAGWEVRDVVTHLFGSGFPKSHDVSKALDKAAGVAREVVGPSRHEGKNTGTALGRINDDGWRPGEVFETAPATDLARQWEGWGTALKPGHEMWILARKPLMGGSGIARNVAEHGTGGLNIAGCRIGEGGHLRWAKPRDMGYHGGTDSGSVAALQATSGRWPANVVLDDAAARALDDAVGERKAGNHPRTRNTSGYSGGLQQGATGHDNGRTDARGPSRFFYTAKASRAERNAGLDGMPERLAGVGDDRPGGSMHERAGDGGPVYRQNHHPTVKPVALMRWLVRLVTPPGGLVLDMFAGSGTTGVACVAEGMRFLGIEREEEYAAIAEARIAHAEAVRDSSAPAMVDDLPLFGRAAD